MSHRHRGITRGASSTREMPTPAGGVVIETFVPWTMVRRGVRTRIITPLGQAQEFQSRLPKAAATDPTPLIRFIGLAHLWQRLLETGHRKGLRDIADDEGIDRGRASRIMRLVMLSPRMVEVAVRGDTTAGLSDLLQGFDDRWEIQEEFLTTGTHRHARRE